MLDSYHAEYKSGNSYSNANVDVTINRAPTDKSVELLMEMEEKALQKLVSSTHVASSEMNATWHIFSSAMDMNYKIKIVVNINNRPHIIDMSMSQFVPHDQRIEQIRKEIMSYLCDKILWSAIETNDNNPHTVSGQKAARMLCDPNYKGF